MMRLWEAKFLSCIVLVAVVSYGLGMNTVHAESSETLLNIYDMTLGGPDKNEIVEEMEEIQSEIEGAEMAKMFTDAKNQSTKFSENVNTRKLLELNDSLDSIMITNESLSDSISEDILTESITELLARDKEYKNNVSRINNTLRKIDFYNGVSYDYSTFDYDFEGMESLLETKRVLYAEALDTFQLGDVTNVRFPLNRERYVTSNYGTRIDPLNKSTTRFHAGTDYRAETGTEVYSLFNGVVSSCGWSNTIGYFVVVEHGENVKTLYCHLSELKCTEGQKVKQYDLIALSGGTGSRCTGPHLHLALYLNGSTYDVDRLFDK